MIVHPPVCHRTCYTLHTHVYSTLCISMYMLHITYPCVQCTLHINVHVSPHTPTQGRTWTQLQPHLEPMWSMVFRALDDLVEPVRLTAMTTFKTLRNVTVRLADVQLTQGPVAGEALGVGLQVLLKQGWWGGVLCVVVVVVVVVVVAMGYIHVPHPQTTTHPILPHTPLHTHKTHNTPTENTHKKPHRCKQHSIRGGCSQCGHVVEAR